MVMNILLYIIPANNTAVYFTFPRSASGKKVQVCIPAVAADFVQTAKLQWTFMHHDALVKFIEKLKAQNILNKTKNRDQYWRLHDRVYQNIQPVQPTEMCPHRDSSNLYIYIYIRQHNSLTCTTLYPDIIGIPKPYLPIRMSVMYI